MAYINGRALTGDQLLGPLIEASGGLTLADLVLDAQVRARLDAAGQMVTTAQAQAEKAMILETLAQDEDTAARLLVELRRSRGLGDERFEALLYRNAGLRGLVGDQAEATEAALKQAYLMRYGPKYRVRLIVTRTMDEAAALRRRAQAGEAFADLAAAHSIDPSAAQGGLLSPISPLDPNYPAAVRNVLPGLDRDPLSPVVVLETGFALVRLEDIIEPQPVEFDQVRDDLAVVVLRRNQRLLMAQLAREMLVDAEVIVLDPALKRSWDDHRRRLIEP